MKRYRQTRSVEGRDIETRVVELKNAEEPLPSSVEVPSDTPVHGWSRPRDSDYSEAAPFRRSEVYVNIPESLAAQDREQAATPKPEVTHGG